MFVDGDLRKWRKENIRRMQEYSPILTLHAAVIQSTAAVCKLREDRAPLVIRRLAQVLKSSVRMVSSALLWSLLLLSLSQGSLPKESLETTSTNIHTSLIPHLVGSVCSVF